jgi:hypothetical protein
MPWWATIYLFLFVAFSIVGDGLNLRDDGFRCRHICDCIAHLIFGAFFAGYWLSAIFRTLGVIAPVLFVAALAWEIYSGPADLREIWRDPDFSRAQRIGLTFLVPLLAWPLYITAGVGLFRFYDSA